jgi:hypothetical protein
VFARWTKAVERLRDRGLEIDYAVRASVESVFDNDTNESIGSGAGSEDVKDESILLQQMDRNVVAAFAPLDVLLTMCDALAIDLDNDLRAERRREITEKLCAYREAALGTAHEATWPAIATPDTASTLDNPTDRKFRPSRLFDSDEISH